MQAYSVGGSVGGFGTRAVSRKTPIYFITIIIIGIIIIVIIIIIIIMMYYHVFARHLIIAIYYLVS